MSIIRLLFLIRDWVLKLIIHRHTHTRTHRFIRYIRMLSWRMKSINQSKLSDILWIYLPLHTYFLYTNFQLFVKLGSYDLWCVCASRDYCINHCHENVKFFFNLSFVEFDTYDYFNKIFFNFEHFIQSWTFKQTQNRTQEQSEEWSKLSLTSCLRIYVSLT